MSNMKRILLNAMVKRDNLYWYEGIPFSGIGFEIGQNDVVRGYEMEQGLICRSYVPLCRHERNSDATMEVDLSDNLVDYEKQTYQEEPYTGIGYIFYEEKCLQEKFFRNGGREARADWSEDGLLEIFGISTGIFGEGVQWHPSGALKSAGISTGSSYVGDLTFTEDGKLRFLSAERNFVNTLPTIVAEARYFPIKSFSEIKQYQYAEETCIWGNDIDDTLMSYMAASGMFKETKKLELSYTSIKRSSFFYSESAPVLREVLIKDKDSLNITVAKHIKLHRPDIRVLFNGVEVEMPTISAPSDDTAQQSTSVKLRGRANETVPKTGWWFSPALGEKGRQRFNAGDKFPSTEVTSLGLVIWGFESE